MAREQHQEHIFSPFFSNRELKCKCRKCEIAYVHKDLLKKLTVARKQANIPFVVNSGCRCPQHNKNVGDTATSDHLVDGIDWACVGIDIQCVSDKDRFTIVKALLEAGINRLGLHPSFIHAGIDERNPGNVIWFYANNP